jgi:hypothetical protein
MRDAPSCEWKHFQDWAVMIMSCHINSKFQGLEKESLKWGHVIYSFFMVAMYMQRDKMHALVDLFEVGELINWMLTINCHLNSCFKSRNPLRAHITKQIYLEAFRTAHEAGICQNRLWSLAVGGGGREEVDLPILMRMVNKYNAEFLKHSGQQDHDACTQEYCCFSTIDNTRVKQLHKCSAHDCGESLIFPASELEKPYERFAWWIDDMNDVSNIPYVVKEESHGQYMAISHVWSDGTGGGVQGEGRVNRCLFKYFKGVAEDLGCTAIWWDTISIPTQRLARQKAISQMHDYFKQASHTIVHDQDLAQFPWTDDGGSCVALLLSTWFTRAWTALELKMSRKEKVSVIYRHPKDPSRYVIKNLEHDILAHHPAYCSRGHWIASSLVSQLREQQFDSIGDILKVLGTKNTSWPRDFMVIAGLFTGHKPTVNTPGFIAHTTRNIILGLVEIEESFLYHGHATMKQKGGFSWCPFSLFDVHIQNNTERQETVYVDEDGNVSGSWEYRLLSKQDARKVRPYSLHVSVDWRIRDALEQWRNCLLLQIHPHENRQALLVVPLDVGSLEICDLEYVVLECQYVGTVYTNIEWGLSYTATVRLGRLTMDPYTSAEEVIDKYEDTKGPRVYGRPWSKHLHSIRQARNNLRTGLEKENLKASKRMDSSTVAT